MDVVAPLEVNLRFPGGLIEIEPSTAEPIARVEPLDVTDAVSVEAARLAKVQRRGRKLTVDVPSRGKDRVRVRVHIFLSLPEDSSVHATSDELTLRSSVAHRNLTIRSGRTEVLAKGVVGCVDIKAGTATVDLGTPRQVVLRTGSGDLTAQEVGDLQFDAASGKAVLGATTGSVSVKGAHVGLELASARGGDVHFRAGAGSAHVGVPEGTSVHLDLTSALGVVHSDVPLAASPPPQAAALRLRLKTGFGDLRVGRAG